MRILIFAAYFYPKIGGYIKNVHELSQRLVQRGHEITIVTCNTEESNQWEIKDKVHIIRFSSWDLLNHNYPVPKLSHRLLSFLFSKSDYDVVITQTRFFATSLLGMLYAKIHKIPHIHVERGSCHTVTKNNIMSIMIQLYDHTIGALIVSNARANAGVSEAACQFIKHLGGKNIRTIYNGITVYNLEERKPSKYINIIFVGRLIFAKGIQDLIQAFEVCCKEKDNLNLWIVGSGDYRETLWKQARESKYCDRIKFFGELSHNQVIEVLSRSDIFVNPSYSEGLPTSVMEAASAKLAIIATDVGGTREIISHGKSGMLFKPHDVKRLSQDILYQVEHRDFAKQLGQEALNTVIQKYDWDKIVDQYEELMKEVVF